MPLPAGAPARGDERMRSAFTLLILCLSVFYTYAAFANLNFLSSTGRLGPGFFPRIIGVALIVACVAELAIARFRPGERPPASDYAGTVVLVGGLTALFVLAMMVVGGYAAMIAFMLATLMILNRGRPVQNLAIALILPTAVYLLFNVWLNAAVPRGMLFERWLG